MKNIISILILSIFCLLSTSCQHEDPDAPVTPVKRTILVFMVASNSLGTNGRDQQDLDEMDRAVEFDQLNGCRLLVYRIGTESDTPLLFEIKKGKRGVIIHETLEVYDSTKGASVTTARMSQVIADAKLHAPAQDYGLILWSHGTGWAPSLTTRPNAPRRVFGEDNGATMALDQLAAAIPVGGFSWIYSDVCYMGAIEVAYQLRHCCRYFVGYPTEIPGRGMPYELTLPYLCADQAQLAQACQETFEYYDIQTGSNRTFSAVVVDRQEQNTCVGLADIEIVQAKGASEQGQDSSHTAALARRSIEEHTIDARQRLPAELLLIGIGHVGLGSAIGALHTINFLLSAILLPALGTMMNVHNT